MHAQKIAELEFSAVFSLILPGSHKQKVNKDLGVPEALSRILNEDNPQLLAPGSPL